MSDSSKTSRYLQFAEYVDTPIAFMWLFDTMPEPVGYWHLVRGPWWRRGRVAEAIGRVSHAWYTLRHGCDAEYDW